MLGPGILSVTGNMVSPIIESGNLMRSVICSGDAHRKQRKMLTPVFSAKHLRALVPVFYQVTRKASTMPCFPPLSSHLASKYMLTSQAAHRRHLIADRGRTPRCRHTWMDGTRRFGAHRPDGHRLLLRPAQRGRRGCIRGSGEELCVGVLTSMSYAPNNLALTPES